MGLPVTTTSTNDLFAVILTVPRVAALRPAAGVSIIKGMLSDRGLNSEIMDINFDFHDSVRSQLPEAMFWSIDEYFFNEHKHLNHQENEFYQQWIHQWIDKILVKNPKWLMISVFTWQAQKFTRDFLTAWKEKTSIPVLIGGQGLIKEENGSYSSKPEFAHDLKKNGLIAHWIRGEVETTLDSLISGNYNCQGIDSDEFALQSDVNQHSYMNFDDFKITQYHSGYETGVLPIESSRGCVRNCVFCDIPTMHGGYRFKKGQRLLDEVLHYYQKYHVRDYFFHDALCNGSVKDFRIFNQGLVDYYKQNKLPDRFIKYSSHYIVRSEQQMKERDFQLMGRAGAECMVIGVESGSDRVKSHMRKGFTNNDLDYNLKMFSKHGITAYFLLIVGFPTETQEDFQQTLDLLKRYQPYVADGTIIGVNLGTTLTIEEGTPIWNEYPVFNIVGVNDQRPQGPDWICQDNPTLSYRERIRRRIQAQEFAISLGYTFWKGDDQLKLLMDNYKTRLNKLAGVIH